MFLIMRKARTLIIVGLIVLAIVIAIWYISTQAGKTDDPPDKSVFVLQKHFIRGKILP